MTINPNQLLNRRGSLGAAASALVTAIRFAVPLWTRSGARAEEREAKSGRVWIGRG